MTIIRPPTPLEKKLLRDHVVLAEGLKRRIVGQDAVIDELMFRLRRRVAARRPGRPIAVFLFAGPPGVGKTELAKALAEALCGRDGLAHIDMGEFGKSPLAAMSLFGTHLGTPSGPGQLTTALERTPAAIVLLDNIHIAHPDVMKRLLAGWNDGFITDENTGRRISTTGAIFILTIYANAKPIGELAADHAGSFDDLSDKVKEMLSVGPDVITPEVLSRIDTAFAFRPLQGIDLAHVVALQIERLTQSYGLEVADRGIAASILLDVVEPLSKTDLKSGVRDVSRRIENMIADRLVEAKAGGAGKVRFELAEGAIKVVPVRE